MRSIERFQPQETKQPWGTEKLVGEGPGYTLKVLFYAAGKGGGLQFHVKKTETFYLISGKGIVRYDKGDGTLTEEPVRAGEPSIHIPAGTPHQFVAVSDCLVVEASTPGAHDRVNVAERYGLMPAVGDLPTTWSAAEIAAFEEGL